MRAGAKKAQVIRMLQRSNGASIAEITRVTQWQPHTARGFISRALVHDLGLKVARFKRDLSPRESITSPTGRSSAKWPHSGPRLAWFASGLAYLVSRRTNASPIARPRSTASGKRSPTDRPVHYARQRITPESRALGETHDALKIPARRAECSLMENVRSPFHAEPGK